MMKYIGVWAGLFAVGVNVVVMAFTRVNYISIAAAGFCLGCAAVSFMIARSY